MGMGHWKAFIVYLWSAFLLECSCAKFADNVLITGSNKGQGLEWVKQLSQLNDPPEYIFATCRKATDKTYTADLDAIARSSTKSKVVVLQMDVTKLDEIKDAARRIERMVGQKGLNVIINNAGIYIRSTNSLEFTNQEDMVNTYKINSLGPVIVTQQFLPLLKKAARNGGNTRSSMSTQRAAVINISSRLGSIELASGSSYSYRMSKAALNMATRLMAKDLRPYGIMAIGFHPGHVKTGMNNYRGPTTPYESINAMMKTLSSFNQSSNGGYFEKDGRKIPF